MSQSADFDSPREQDSLHKSRLQCVVDERYGVCHDDLSVGVHVSGDPAVADVYEVGQE